MEPARSSTANTVAQITQIIGVLTQVNVAIPVVVSVITSVIGIVKALRGTAPPLDQIIAQIEAQVAENTARGKAELARLRALGE